MFIQEEVYVKYFYLKENKSVEWSCLVGNLILYLDTFPPDTVQTLPPLFIALERAPFSTPPRTPCVSDIAQLRSLSPYVCAPFRSLLASGHLLIPLCPCSWCSSLPPLLRKPCCTLECGRGGDSFNSACVSLPGLVCRTRDRPHVRVRGRAAPRARRQGKAGARHGLWAFRAGGASAWSPWAPVVYRGPGLSCAT